MSAGIEFKIFMDNIRGVIFGRNENMNRMNSSIRNEIENTKKDLEKLQNISSNNIEEYKNKSISMIAEYLNFFLSKNELEEVKKYKELLEEVEKTDNFFKIYEIYGKATDYYDEYKFNIEEKNDEELLKEYIISKLQEMGGEIYIDEDGKIISPRGDSDLVIEIENDNLKLDIPGKGRSCVSTLMEFERLTQNELKKSNMEWHTLEKEKKIKKSASQIKNKINFNQIYDKKLMEKNGNKK